MDDDISEEWIRYERAELDDFSSDELSDLAAELRSDLRDLGDVKRATNESEYLISYLLAKNEYELTELWRPLAILQYELGYCFYLTGDAAKAGAEFQNSAISSEKAQHPVGVQIGRALFAYVKLLLSNPDYLKIQDEMNSALTNLLRHQQNNPSDTLCQQWISNLYRDLFIAAIDAGDTDRAEQRLIQWRQSGIRQARTKDPDSETGKRFRLVELSCDAQLFALKGEPQKALGCFAEYLPLPLRKWGSFDTALKETTERAENISRDYYFAGTILNEVGMTELSKTCLEAGLVTKDMNANSYYQEKTKALLKTHVKMCDNPRVQADRL